MSACCRGGADDRSLRLTQELGDDDDGNTSANTSHYSRLRQQSDNAVLETRLTALDRTSEPNDRSRDVAARQDLDTPSEEQLDNTTNDTLRHSLSS